MKQTSVWNIVGAIAALAALTLTVVLFLISRADTDRRTNKGIEIEIQPATTIASAITDRAPNLALYFDSQPISAYTVLRARVRNSGAQPITANDFAVPLRFGVGGATRLVETRITNEQPSDLGASAVLSSGTGSVQIVPLLLNPGDQFDLEIDAICTSDKTPYLRECTGRIEGIKEIPFTLSAVFLPDHSKYSKWFIDWVLPILIVLQGGALGAGVPKLLEILVRRRKRQQRNAP